MTVVQEAYGEGGGGGAAARPAVPVYAGLHHHGDEPHATEHAGAVKDVAIANACKRRAASCKSHTRGSRFQP